MQFMKLTRTSDNRRKKAREKKEENDQPLLVVSFQVLSSWTRPRGPKMFPIGPSGAPQGIASFDNPHYIPGKVQ